VSPTRHLRRARRLVAALAVAAAGTALAGCGTPAVVQPVQTPLPGFQRDIQAAQNVVSQSAQQAQAYGATGATTP
jgi:predicted small secreted protein